ncbi:MAG TPA: ABC transporter ATP-binding protein [Syntrophomonadaceae bacterium]|nr:ABC transporter ATP-binding protein [Syntrophomonadaceae bacterium]
MPAVEMHDVYKSFKNSHFDLKIDELQIQKGSIFGVLGPNGAGKSTLLKILMDLVKADKGQIRLLDCKHQERSRLQARTAFMPENKDLYASLTVEQMLDLAARLVPGWRQQKASHLLTLFPLRSEQKISTLSWGEKTQLYTIITFAKAADLYLLDEPTRGLDPVMQERMLSLIKEESIDGHTIIFSSHQIAELEETIDALMILKQGRIALSGELDLLKENCFLLASTTPDHSARSWLEQHARILGCRHVGEHLIYLCQSDASFQERTQKNQPQLQFLDFGLKQLFITLVESEEDNHAFIP